MESDVVVVGHGGAGAVAAITAHDAGAQVTILEKMPAGGGNTYLAGGTIFNPKGMEAVGYLEAVSFGTVEREIIETFVENSFKNADWIRELGGEVEPYVNPTVSFPSPTSGRAGFPNTPGAEYISKWGIKGPESEGTKGQRLWKLLSSNVERRGIRVLTSTPAKELITNERGEVVGVIAEREGERVSIKAKRAVILTCGGFEFDDAMKWDFLPCKPMYGLGNPGNTGDGIRMAQRVGAALWHMTAVSASLGLKVPEYEIPFRMHYYHQGIIYVDKDGRRFVNEVGLEHHDMWRPLSVFDPNRLDYRRLPCWVIFDEVNRRKGPLWAGGGRAHPSGYEWSLDNTAEIKKGWIIQGKTIPELARKMQVDESTLESTLAKYNEYCKVGRDADFNRPRENLVPIETPPYYAIKQWPCLINTQGGPRRDKEARVLYPDGTPIPRLYSAGELGSIWGFVYQGSTNIGECFVFGRIAGRNATGEKPWS